MPIRSLVEGESGVFGSGDVAVLTAAFEDILRTMHLVDRSDPAVMMVAKCTIEIAKQGERDPVKLRDKVVKLITTFHMVKNSL
jgi:hypothetical protein